MASPPSPSTKKLKLDEAAAVLLKEGNIITLKSKLYALQMFHYNIFTAIR